jgi:cyclophilin family peptidyl-prolyl cis-trans isomerase
MSAKKKIFISVTVVLLVLVIACGTALGLWINGVFDKKEPTLYTRNAKTAGFYEYYMENGYISGKYARLTFSDGTESYDIEIYLDEKHAPITVANFIGYANDGFYDGTVIHRVVKDYYCFQGGGYVYDNGYVVKANDKSAIAGEFSSNTSGDYTYNTLSHFAGAISMARGTSYNTATDQFFISWDDYPEWDGSYAAFGFIVDKADVEIIKNLGENVKTDSGDYPKTVITLTKAEIFEI